MVLLILLCVFLVLLLFFSSRDCGSVAGVSCQSHAQNVITKCEHTHTFTETKVVLYLCIFHNHKGLRGALTHKHINT